MEKPEAACGDQRRTAAMVKDGKDVWRADGIFRRKRRDLENKLMPSGHRDGISDFERLIFMSDWLLLQPKTTDTALPLQKDFCRRYGFEILHPAFADEGRRKFV